MVSIAHIPFCGSSFWGCICAILYQGREYRLATYRGVKVQSFSPEHICLSQGRVLLELDMAPSHVGHPLRAPQCGKMSNTIRESCNAHLRARLWERGKQYLICKVTMLPMNSSQVMGRKTRKNILFSFWIILSSKQSLGRSIWNHCGSKPGSDRTFQLRTEI